MQKFIMMVGIPGSGKTTAAQELKDTENAVIFSSDDIREELYGDASVQGNPKKVFEIMDARVVEALAAGKNVIYDATNIRRDNRLRVLDMISGFECRRYCIVVQCLLDEAIARQSRRNRVVPTEVILRMDENMQMPVVDEGWDGVYQWYN